MNEFFEKLASKLKPYSLKAEFTDTEIIIKLNTINNPSPEPTIKSLNSFFQQNFSNARAESIGMQANYHYIAIRGLSREGIQSVKEAL
ncbi:hypothetical protein HUU53_00295 [Candidatus Micrarchaeota archaeon]|nr:hypothetical protein [Candidatus Micrarchaeota archaeon]